MMLKGKICTILINATNHAKRIVWEKTSIVKGDAQQLRDGRRTHHRFMTVFILGQART
jgi:hypothetical protein